MHRLSRWIGTLALLATACGGSSGGGSGSTVTTTSTPPTGFVITVANFAYSPLNLAVPPGATVTVVNDDATLHSVTSESRAGAYTPGGVNGISFDSGEFTTGQRTFTIPAGAQAGTVIPYYCTAHVTGMVTPNGTITIDPNAKPQTAPAPASTGSPGY